jgi:UDP-N-acetylmuramate--alanine ligase
VTQQQLPGNGSVPDLRSLAQSGSVHFMGVGGAGMSALAELVARAGGRVSGCDHSPGESVARLRELGITTLQGHDPAHVHGAAALVVTAAVPADHPELRAARALGVPVVKRAQALGAIVNHGRVIAVAGTHGKTTTTTMLASILAEAGLDPTALVGGRVAEWGSGLRAGRDDLFVVEADEYDRSFLALAPDLVVLTSVEADHLDIYGDLAGVERAFAQFLELLPVDGPVLACADDAGVGRVAAGSGRRLVWYGTGPGAALRAIRVSNRAGGSSFDVAIDGAALGRVELNAPGEHNVRNALGAIGAARELGASFAAAQRALARFGGVARRFQRVGEARGIVFIDDYAHHPTEIAATLRAARDGHVEGRIVAVFQPHLYSRTRDLAAEFGAALAAADLVFLTDVYPAREQRISGVTGELVAGAALAAGAPDVRYHATLAELERALAIELHPGDLCVGMGAGDIDAAVRRVHRRLQESES